MVAVVVARTGCTGRDTVVAVAGILARTVAVAVAAGSNWIENIDTAVAAVARPVVAAVAVAAQTVFDWGEGEAEAEGPCRSSSWRKINSIQIK